MQWFYHCPSSCSQWHSTERHLKINNTVFLKADWFLTHSLYWIEVDICSSASTYTIETKEFLFTFTSKIWLFTESVLLPPTLPWNCFQFIDILFHSFLNFLVDALIEHNTLAFWEPDSFIFFSCLWTRKERNQKGRSYDQRLLNAMLHYHDYPLVKPEANRCHRRENTGQDWYTLINNKWGRLKFVFVLASSFFSSLLTPALVFHCFYIFSPDALFPT